MSEHEYDPSAAVESNSRPVPEGPDETGRCRSDADPSHILARLPDMDRDPSEPAERSRRSRGRGEPERQRIPTKVVVGTTAAVLVLVVGAFLAGRGSNSDPLPDVPSWQPAPPAISAPEAPKWGAPTGQPPNAATAGFPSQGVNLPGSTDGLTDDSTGPSTAAQLPVGIEQPPGQRWSDRGPSIAERPLDTATAVKPQTGANREMNLEDRYNDDRDGRRLPYDNRHQQAERTARRADSTYQEHPRRDYQSEDYRRQDRQYDPQRYPSDMGVGQPQPEPRRDYQTPADAYRDGDYQTPPADAYRDGDSGYRDGREYRYREYRTPDPRNQTPYEREPGIDRRDLGDNYRVTPGSGYPDRDYRTGAQRYDRRSYQPEPRVYQPLDSRYDSRHEYRTDSRG